MAKVVVVNVAVTLTTPRTCATGKVTVARAVVDPPNASLKVTEPSGWSRLPPVAVMLAVSVTF